jgi:hypothetical protein
MWKLDIAFLTEQEACKEADGWTVQLFTKHPGSLHLSALSSLNKLALCPSVCHQDPNVAFGIREVCTQAWFCQLPLERDRTSHLTSVFVHQLNKLNKSRRAAGLMAELLYIKHKLGKQWAHKNESFFPLLCHNFIVVMAYMHCFEGREWDRVKRKRTIPTVGYF